MLRRHLAIAALLAMCSGLLIVGGAGPARGACSADGDMVKALTEAEVVFVGSVYSVSSHDRIAVMEVLEIWKGPILQATVGVHGGNASSSAVRPDDRTFEAGRTYLVVPTNGEPPFVDSLCTATQLYRPTGEIPTEYKYAVGASDVRYTEAVAAVAAQPSALTELGGYVNDPTV
ncbi:MAG: hypothetical protein QNJ77_05370, partial [Acidimicrobiia bacterium]|nr:hypothetical protein [Acidimicrobiia bacterium]